MSELEAEPFSDRASEDGVVFLEFHGQVSRSGRFHGRVVKTIRGDQARVFTSRIEGLTGREAQPVLANITGHFQRGSKLR
jgi:hypothetical protein